MTPGLRAAPVTSVPPSATLNPRRVLVVANPATRRDPDRLVRTLVAAAPPDAEITVRRTVPGRSVGELYGPELEAAELVVAVGGDGTVAEVASALADRDLPLAIIPGGSTNIVARELGIPTNPAAAARLIFGPHRLHALDLGRCAGRGFLHMAGAGVDSRMFQATNPGRKRRVGWLAYLLPAARSIFAPPVRFSIVADGSRVDVTARLVLVANGNSILHPGLPLYPGIRSDDGWLDVLVWTTSGPFAVFRTLARFATRSLTRSPFVVHLRCRAVQLIAEPPLPVEVDGDVIATTPVTVRIDPARLRVVVPRAER